MTEAIESTSIGQGVPLKYVADNRRTSPLRCLPTCRSNSSSSRPPLPRTRRRACPTPHLPSSPGRAPHCRVLARCRPIPKVDGASNPPHGGSGARACDHARLRDASQPTGLSYRLFADLRGGTSYCYHDRCFLIVVPRAQPQHRRARLGEPQHLPRRARFRPMASGVSRTSAWFGRSRPRRPRTRRT